MKAMGGVGVRRGIKLSFVADFSWTTLLIAMTWNLAMKPVKMKEHL